VCVCVCVCVHVCKHKASAKAGSTRCSWTDPLRTLLVSLSSILAGEGSSGSEEGEEGSSDDDMEALLDGGGRCDSRSLSNHQLRAA